MKHFGKKLQQCIKANEYKQCDIARMLGIRKSTITNWVKGRAYPNLETFKELCTILNESANYLLGLKD